LERTDVGLTIPIVIWQQLPTDALGPGFLASPMRSPRSGQNPGRVEGQTVTWQVDHFRLEKWEIQEKSQKDKVATKTPVILVHHRWTLCEIVAVRDSASNP